MHICLFEMFKVMPTFFNQVCISRMQSHSVYWLILIRLGLLYSSKQQKQNEFTLKGPVRSIKNFGWQGGLRDWGWTPNLTEDIQTILLPLWPQTHWLTGHFCLYRKNGHITQSFVRLYSSLVVNFGWRNCYFYCNYTFICVQNVH